MTNYFLKKRSTLILLNLFCVVLPVSAQRDFNDFKMLMSEGQIPEDFTAKTYSKVLEDIKSKKADVKFTRSNRMRQMPFPLFKESYLLLPDL